MTLLPGGRWPQYGQDALSNRDQWLRQRKEDLTRRLKWTIPAIANQAVEATFDSILRCDATDGSFTVTLPVAGDKAGESLVIRLVSASANTVTIQAKGTELIEGVTSIALNGVKQSIELVSDGTNWMIVEREALAYGEISVIDNGSTTAVSSAAKTQFLHFDTNGPSANTTPDNTNDHITILRDGVYFIACSAVISNNGAGNHEGHFEVYVNNGATMVGAAHAHRTLTGTASGSVSMSGIASLSADDTVELWFHTDSVAAKNIIGSDITLSVMRLGGF